MTETTVTVAGKTLTIDRLGRLYADVVAGKCLDDIDRFKKVVEAAVANAKCIDASMTDVTNGSNFCVTFQKKGESHWTRLHFPEQALLRELALEELESRQEAVLTTLADALGVDDYTIAFGD